MHFLFNIHVTSTEMLHKKVLNRSQIVLIFHSFHQYRNAPNGARHGTTLHNIALPTSIKALLLVTKSRF